MESLLKIGASKEAVDTYGNKVVDIFKKGFENHMDQATIQVALQTMSSALSVNNTVVSNCTLAGGGIEKGK
jgi:hypothetical protein